MPWRAGSLLGDWAFERMAEHCEVKTRKPRLLSKGPLTVEIQ
jgi:hypothetical protein